MWNIRRSFTQLMKHTPSAGLKGKKVRIFSKKLIYRLLMTGTAASVIATVYLLNPAKPSAISGGSTKYVQPAEILELGVSFDYKEYYLVGVIKPGTIRIDQNTKHHSFVITDFIHDIKVYYDGVLPTTFREGETARVSGEFIDEYNPVEMVATYVQGAHDAEKTKTTYQPRARDVSIKSRAF